MIRMLDICGVLVLQCAKLFCTFFPPVAILVDLVLLLPHVSEAPCPSVLFDGTVVDHFFHLLWLISSTLASIC